nr:laccase 13 [Cyathus bulleri]
MSGALPAQELLPNNSVYTLPANNVIEISLPGGSTGSPHAFDVVRGAGNSTYNYVNPVRRDVVSIGPDTTDNIIIRFQTDNAGPWILRCHIDWHLGLGLAVVLAEDVDTVANTTIPTAWDNLCPTYDALPSDEL